MTKVFYDLEFVERGAGIPIQLISAGVVTEGGEEFYAINEECLSSVAMIPWLANNVWPHLPARSDGMGIIEWDKDHAEYRHVLSLDRLTHSLREFLTAVPDLELWGYYAAYDHVVLCQLFGTMVDLPPGIPMWTHELMQLLEQTPEGLLPPQPDDCHHALVDARWNRDAYYALRPEEAPAPKPVQLELEIEPLAIEAPQLVDMSAMQVSLAIDNKPRGQHRA